MVGCESSALTTGAGGASASGFFPEEQLMTKQATATTANTEPGLPELAISHPRSLVHLVGGSSPVKQVRRASGLGISLESQSQKTTVTKRKQLSQTVAPQSARC